MNIIRKNGFTIAEVLVVIAIFLIMIAALGPFVRMAKIRAHNLNCANNLRKLSLGLHAYAVDHNDEFPPNLGALYPNYVEEIRAFDCPASRSIGTPDNPDYRYMAGLTEISSPKEVIAQDLDNNHKRSGKNALRIDGSVTWAEGH